MTVNILPNATIAYCEFCIGLYSFLMCFVRTHLKMFSANEYPVNIRMISLLTEHLQSRSFLIP